MKELPRVKRRYNPFEDQNVNFLVIQVFYLNFAAFTSKFINTYILLNFKFKFREKSYVLTLYQTENGKFLRYPMYKWTIFYVR